MAVAGSEGLPITPISLANSTHSETRSVSRSPSLASVREFQWPSMLVLSPGSRRSTKSPKGKSARDPVMIERSNLVNISKLVVKELIDQSLRYGRMLDSDHMPLQHFFIVLEHVLRHGLRPKKGLLGPKKELWDILQMVEKYAPEAIDITASVRDLPTVRTHMGRARAWLRIALMQKKLADYLNVLIDNKHEILAEYFEPEALMLSEEAIVITGLLVGLNVIDCNLCVKEEDLDYPQGVIDFSLYLRSSNQITGDPNEDSSGDNMITVLDQKNYIEELNRHLNATVANLQAKVESLTTTNALMKEDLAISKNNLLSIYDENIQLKQELGQEVSIEKFEVVARNTPERKSVDNGEMEEFRQRLEEERKLRQETDKELELQMCLKAEMEVAMKLLEKDIHEKQDTIISLRRQLDDIKLINLEMYKKLQECEMELTQKGEMVSRLQVKASQIGKILNNLEKHNHMINEAGRSFDKDRRRPLPRMEPLGPLRSKSTAESSTSSSKNDNGSVLKELKDWKEFKEAKDAKEKLESKIDKEYRDCEKYRVDAEESKRQLGRKMAEHAEHSSNTEDDLKVEREWRVTLQETMQQDRDKISNLTQELTHLKAVATKYATLQEDYYTLKEQCLEQEQAMEELGTELSYSKLQVSDLQEEVYKNKAEGTWANDKGFTNCKLCKKDFNITRRRHHCRNCGDIFCNACSDNSMALPSSAKPVRVCDECHVKLVARYSVIK